MSLLLKQNKREQNILEYHHLVEHIAHRLRRRLPNHVDIEELKSVGYIGLIEAIDRYDPTRGVPFRAYAEIRIQGSMLDHLRKEDWVPRSIRRRMKILSEARDAIREQGLEVNDQNVAAHLNMEQSELQDLMFDSQVRRLISSHTLLDQNNQGVFLEDMIPSPDDSPLDDAEKQERNKLLYLALQDLKEREKKVLILYYFKNRNLRKIGEQFDITESRACQLRKSALQSLYRSIRRRMAS
jgi:RNA polymerase sigma factor FliA